MNRLGVRRVILILSVSVSVLQRRACPWEREEETHGSSARELVLWWGRGREPENPTPSARLSRCSLTLPAKLIMTGVNRARWWWGEASSGHSQHLLVPLAHTHILPFHREREEPSRRVKPSTSHRCSSSSLAQCWELLKSGKWCGSLNEYFDEVKWVCATPYLFQICKLMQNVR